MTICKYFQQGTCRFGDRCRYEHVYYNDDGGDYSSGSGTSVLNRNKSVVQPTGSSFFSQATPVGSGSNTLGQFGGGFFNQATAQLRTNAPTQFPGGSFFSQSTPTPVETRSSAPVSDLTKDVVQMVTTELMLSEKGGQWPLSCFAPFKERGCFPGLEDHSPEELRLLAYEALKTNALEECTRKVNELYERNRAVKKQIFSRSAEVVSIIEKLFKGEKIDSFPSSLFTTQQTPAVATSFSFALPTGKSGDAGNSASQTVFGGSASGTPSTSIFGAPDQSVANQNVFSGPSHNSPFTRGLESSPAFKESNSTSFFNQPSKGIFSGDSGSPSQGIFGSSSTSQNPGIFGSSNTSQSPGIFGVNTSTLSQADQSVIEGAVYTILSELTEEEKEIFNSKTFTMGKVPTKAPAKEHCL